MKRIMFFHMPKCAGRSLNNFLIQDYYGKWAMYQGDKLSKAQMKQFNKMDLLTGHLSWSATETFPDLLPVSLFRDPLERTISEYNHLMTQDTNFEATHELKNNNYSFMEFIRSDIPFVFAWINVYLAYLGFYVFEDKDEGRSRTFLFQKFVKQAKRRIDKFDFIGIYEHLDITIKLLKAKYGFTGELLSFGETADKDKITKYEDLSEGEIDEAEEILWPDYALYDYALEKFHKEHFKFIGRGL